MIGLKKTPLSNLSFWNFCHYISHFFFVQLQIHSKQHIWKMKVWSSTRYIASPLMKKKIVLVNSISQDIFFYLAHFFVKSNFCEIFVKLISRNFREIRFHEKTRCCKSKIFSLCGVLLPLSPQNLEIQRTRVWE